jgi:hypothetical protein
MNRNTKKMQCRKRYNCQKNEFVERFPFVCHMINILFRLENEDTRLGIPGIF